MTRFDAALAFTLRWETSRFTNDPKDPGGATRWGITQRTYDAFRLADGLPSRSVKLVERKEAAEVYWRGFWLPHRCDFLPPPVDLVHFDNAVLVGKPGELLQAAADASGTLVTDGIVGPRTLAAVGAWNPRALARVLAAARLGYHVANNAVGAGRFTEGWINRAHDLMREIEGD